VAAQSENHGPEQARLDDIADARVSVTGLMPERAPPHLELLGYHVGTRRPIAAATTTADVAATAVHIEVDDLDETISRAGAARLVSPGIVTLADGTRAACAFDPDGHRFVIEERARAMR
jgi:hypothetical protein